MESGVERQAADRVPSHPLSRPLRSLLPATTTAWLREPRDDTRQERTILASRELANDKVGHRKVEWMEGVQRTVEDRSTNEERRAIGRGGRMEG